MSSITSFIFSMEFLAGLAVGYFLLGQLLGLVFGTVGSLTGGKGGASPTGYPVNEGRY